MLLSYGGWRRGTAVDQLPDLLAPMGIHTFRATSGEQSAQLIRSHIIHIAVVDFDIPLAEGQSAAPTPSPDAAPAGPRILQLLRRLPGPPPTVVIRPMQASHRESSRSLTEALREGAFAVIDQPLSLESMLEVMRRILRRHYANCWPCRDQSASTDSHPNRPANPPPFG
ncbi:MAG TPA: hypothetical protein VG711_05435 [Phycisphaerales bacterium]|nr:hypothetical protein [Phycisphaerales bacterium]